MEAAMLPDAECKTHVKMLRELWETTDELSERNKRQ